MPPSLIIAGSWLADNLPTLVISIVTSGLFSIWVTHRLATTRADRDLKRQKLEQLFMASTRYHNRLSTSEFAFRMEASGKDFKELVSNLTPGQLNIDDEDTVIMLCNLYFPTLVAPAEAINVKYVSLTKQYLHYIRKKDTSDYLAFYDKMEKEFSR